MNDRMKEKVAEAKKIPYKPSEPLAGAMREVSDVIEKHFGARIASFSYEASQGEAGVLNLVLQDTKSEGLKGFWLY